MATVVTQDWNEFRYQDNDEQITIQRRYKLTHDVGDTPNLSLLPAINSADATWPAAKCTNRELRQIGPATYDCYATFQSLIGNGGIDPTTLPTKWNVSIGQLSVKINSDKDENIIKNSCGDPYEGLTGTIPTVIITATKYYSSLILNTIVSASDKVNNATWNPSSGLFQVGARKALLTGVNINDFDEDSTYFQAVFRFQMKSAKTGSPEGHKLRIVDEGKSYFADAAGTKRVPVTDQDGQAVYGKVLLNGHGRKAGQSGGIALPPGATLTQINNNNYLDYDVKEEYNYDNLGL